MNTRKNSPERSGSKQVRLYDTTLRDGTQREGICLSCDDKLRILRRLDTFGVSFVEMGWPGSNPKDQEVFARVRELNLKNTTVTAFGSTRRAGIAPDEDPQLASLIAADTDVCTIFGKSSVFHVTQVLRTEPEENLRMIEQSVAWLREQGRRVIYDAEHFFDGYFEDRGYAIATLQAAIAGGAEVVVLCDTNGGMLPWLVDEVVRHLVDELRDHPLGIHAHNDSGCGVANSLAAARAGVRHVQGTVNGYGERCGNANLCAVIPGLELKMNLSSVDDEGLRGLVDLSRFVAEVSNLTQDAHLPYVGRSAFAHKGGVHVSAIRRAASSYEHIEPARVGNQSRVVVSELSGRSNVLSKAEEFGLVVDESSGAKVLERIKKAESEGMAYEAAEASVALLLAREAPDYEAPFQVVDYQVAVRRQGADPWVEATVKVAVNDQVLSTVAEDTGPVGALDAALRKALTPGYPELEEIHLVDYKVRILDSQKGTAATTRVLIDHRSHRSRWSTVGASPNIIFASLTALVDGIEYGLREHRLGTTRKAPAHSEPAPKPGPDQEKAREAS